jgi:extradiol dioxygenase family protein
MLIHRYFYSLHVILVDVVPLFQWLILEDINMNTPFHAFFYVTDVKASIRFYHDYLGFPLIVSNEKSFTIDFFGHGISFEYVEDFKGLPNRLTCSATDVDGRQYVPSMHWGINLYDKSLFDEYLQKCENHGIEFVVQATRYNVGSDKEQCLFFVKDPTGYILEFRFMSKEFKIKELNKWDQRSEGHEREYLKT